DPILFLQEFRTRCSSNLLGSRVAVPIATRGQPLPSSGQQGSAVNPLAVAEELCTARPDPAVRNTTCDGRTIDPHLPGGRLQAVQLIRTSTTSLGRCQGSPDDLFRFHLRDEREPGLVFEQCSCYVSVTVPVGFALLSPSVRERILIYDTGSAGDLAATG